MDYVTKKKRNVTQTCVIYSRLFLHVLDLRVQESSVVGCVFVVEWDLPTGEIRCYDCCIFLKDNQRKIFRLPEFPPSLFDRKEFTKFWARWHCSPIDQITLLTIITAYNRFSWLFTPYSLNQMKGFDSRDGLIHLFTPSREGLTPKSSTFNKEVFFVSGFVFHSLKVATGTCSTFNLTVKCWTCSPTSWCWRHSIPLTLPCNLTAFDINSLGISLEQANFLNWRKNRKLP